MALVSNTRFSRIEGGCNEITDDVGQEDESRDLLGINIMVILNTCVNIHTKN